jgi:hypothetical protein
MTRREARACVAELTVVHRCTDRALRGVGVVSQDDTFTCCKSVRLENDWKAKLSGPHDRESVIRIRGNAVSRGWDPVPRHEIFREYLAALQLRSGARRTEQAETAHCKRVRDTGIERKLGTDDRQGDPLALRKITQRIDLVGFDRGRARDRRDPWIARRAYDFRDTGIALQFPGERVLPATAADNQHFHR